MGIHSENIFIAILFPMVLTLVRCNDICYSIKCLPNSSIFLFKKRIRCISKYLHICFYFSVVDFISRTHHIAVFQW